MDRDRELCTKAQTGDILASELTTNNEGDASQVSILLAQIDEAIYLVKSNSGIPTAVDPATGQAHDGPVRLDGIFEIYASPVGVAGNVIILGRDGNALVLENVVALRLAFGYGSAAGTTTRLPRMRKRPK